MERIISMAATLFRTKGYAGSTTRELAALLGLQAGSLYHHVSGKEDLLYAMCLQSMQEVHDQVERTLRENDRAAPLTRLRAMIRSHVVASVTDQDRLAAMLIELRALTPERRGTVLEVRERFIQLVRQAIGRAQMEGALRQDIPAKYLTLGLFNLVNWSIFWFRPGGELDAGSLGELLARLFLEGAVTATRHDVLVQHTAAGLQDLRDLTHQELEELAHYATWIRARRGLAAVETMATQPGAAVDEAHSLA